jgi:hypothetical protein
MPEHRVRIVSSVLPADLARLGEACQAPEKACADRIQWDVMGTSRVWIVDPLDVPAGTGSTPRLVTVQPLLEILDDPARPPF